MRILQNKKKIDKIEVLKPLSENDGIVITFDDARQIRKIVAFFRSLNLTAFRPFLDCRRPAERLKLYYCDDAVDTILFGFSNITYNGTFFKIDDDAMCKAEEFDRLIYGN